MTRRLEELELKRLHEVQAVAEAPVQSNNNAPYGNTTTQVGGIIQISHEGQSNSYQQRNQPSQQSSSLEQSNSKSQQVDNIQYSISRLTNLNTRARKWKISFSTPPKPKGVHEVESQEGESSQMKDVKP
ncbi:hypothetical protein CK203_040387 [Vitis vinifera]|uniref:Uncharacterized protein n=1 Tax=Vitis vinifera TaxID=29760 RepID=A0A438FX34_VITVI|nr:hypothetical protein CK203_040387 [Vitis vinifera]